MTDAQMLPIEAAIELAARKDEAERCALLCEELANRYEASAVKTRADGTYTNGWPFHNKFVRPRWEDAAKALDSAASGLRTVATGCRKGWDTRK